MNNARRVLVLTEADDPTADLVIEELNDRDVPIARFDTSDFPSSLTVAADINGLRNWRGWLRTPTREVDLTAVRSLYYRRPSDFDFSRLEPQQARFAASQARFGLGGLLADLPGCLYVNHPNAIADAEYKPVQLSVAASVGLRVSPTLITNDPEEARAFARGVGRIIYKPLYLGLHDLDGQPASIWVKEVDLEDLDDSIAGTMHLFQARCDKVADLRVTVIGDKVFCVKIKTESPDLLDWRYDYDHLSYTVVEPPAGIVDSMQAYMKRFDLVFGCFDFAVPRNGGPVFLECNPNGQWGWLEEATGLPMTAAVADLLQKGTR
ncbi:ATP-grasp ribosomal peptide maturase [Streptomyces sp. SID13031]|nr:ATP-grasp ribosomal peptide maturase [Streptomyces sp. SID13031]NEA35136.1 ATP-grasp ribosomal peptide maturase [Streptomyces sp. SID13031]